MAQATNNIAQIYRSAWDHFEMLGSQVNTIIEASIPAKQQCEALKQVLGDTIARKAKDLVSDIEYSQKSDVSYLHPDLFTREIGQKITSELFPNRTATYTGTGLEGDDAA